MQSNMKKKDFLKHYIPILDCFSYLCQKIIMLLIEPGPDPREGQKGHMPPPPPPPQGIPCSRKEKKLLIDLITPKASCEKMVPVRVVHSDLILARLQSVQMVGH